MKAGGKWLATFTAVVGTFSVVLSSTILIVAMPRIMEDLAIDQGTAQWLVTGFLIAMIAAMLTNMWSVERFGLRATYIGAMAVFCVGGVLGASGPGIEWLITARVLQGAAAGVIQPVGMVLIFRVFPESERGRGYGLYGLGTIVAPAIAPMLGGFMVEWVSWRATFLVALPGCGIGALMALRHLSGREVLAPARPFDIVGLMLVIGSLTALIWASSLGTRTGWAGPMAFGVLVGGVAGLGGFLLRQWFHPAPLLDLRVFKSPVVVGGGALTAAVGGGTYAMSYVLPLYLQHVIGLSPSAAGALMTPAGLAMGVCFPIAGWLADRAHPAVPVMGGCGLFIASCVLLATWGATAGLTGLAFMIVAGRVGLGLILPAAMAGVMAGLGRREISQASGVLSFGRQISAALGVSLISILLDPGSGAHQEGGAGLGETARWAKLAHGYSTAFLAMAAGMAVVPPALWWMRKAG